MRLEIGFRQTLTVRSGRDFDTLFGAMEMLLTIEQAATRLQLHRDTVRRHIKRGELRALSAGAFGACQKPRSMKSPRRPTW